MTRLLMSFSLLACASSLVHAQDVALVFTGTIYSRDLTEEERELASERTKIAARPGQTIWETSEEIRMLETRTKKIDQVSASVLLENGKSISVRSDSKEMLIQAHLLVHSVNEQECDLDLHWGVGALVEGVSGVGFESDGRTKLLMKGLRIDGRGTTAPRKGNGPGAILISTIQMVPAKSRSLDDKKTVNPLGLLQQKFPRPRGQQLLN